MQMQPQGMVPNQQAGMQQQMGGNMMQQQMGSVGPQHSMVGLGQPMQINASRPPSYVKVEQPAPMVIKSELGAAQPSNMPMMQQQRMQVPSQPQQSDTQPMSVQGNTQDPIVRFKQLLPQLKEALNTLILVARQNFIANATIDNLEKTGDTSLLPHFDKALERFYMTCDQIQANLCLASSQMTQTLFSMQQAPLTTNQMKDNVNSQAYTNYIMTVKQQLMYAKEIQSMLVDSSNKARPHQQPPPGSGHMP